MPNFVGAENQCYKVKSKLSDKYFVGVLEKSDNDEGELMHYFTNVRFSDGTEADHKDIYDSAVAPGVGAIWHAPIVSNACGGGAAGAGAAGAGTSGGRRRRRSSRRTRRRSSRRTRRR